MTAEEVSTMMTTLIASSLPSAPLIDETTTAITVAYTTLFATSEGNDGGLAKLVASITYDDNKVALNFTSAKMATLLNSAISSMSSSTTTRNDSTAAAVSGSVRSHAIAYMSRIETCEDLAKLNLTTVGFDIVSWSALLAKISDSTGGSKIIATTFATMIADTDTVTDIFTANGLSYTALNFTDAQAMEYLNDVVTAGLNVKTEIYYPITSMDAIQVALDRNDFDAIGTTKAAVEEILHAAMDAIPAGSALTSLYIYRIKLLACIFFLLMLPCYRHPKEIAYQ